MDAAESQLLAETIARIVDGTSAEKTVPALQDAGIQFARDEDEAAVLGVLFEAAGRALSRAPLVDLLIPGKGSTGTAPSLLLPAGIGAPPTAAIVGDELVIDALAMSADGNLADTVVVGLPDSLAIFPATCVTADATGGIDPSLGLMRVGGKVPSERVRYTNVGNVDTLRRLVLRCLGHELVGAGQRSTDLATDHVLNRHQFGQPLAVRQTVQHRLVDVHVALVSARELLRVAWACDDDAMVFMAKGRAATAALAAVACAQQLTGALGFTWEFGLHDAVRRVHVLDFLLGTSEEIDAFVGASLLSGRTIDPVPVGL